MTTATTTADRPVPASRNALRHLAHWLRAAPGPLFHVLLSGPDADAALVLALERVAEQHGGALVASTTSGIIVVSDVVPCPEPGGCGWDHKLDRCCLLSGLAGEFRGVQLAGSWAARFTARGAAERRARRRKTGA